MCQLLTMSLKNTLNSKRLYKRRRPIFHNFGSYCDGLKKKSLYQFALEFFPLNFHFDSEKWKRRSYYSKNLLNKWVSMACYVKLFNRLLFSICFRWLAAIAWRINKFMRNNNYTSSLSVQIYHARSRTVIYAWFDIVIFHQMCPILFPSNRSNFHLSPFRRLFYVNNGDWMLFDVDKYMFY